MDFIFSYLDDILIFSVSREQHVGHLKFVFERLKQFGLLLNLEKLNFIKSEIDFLGYVISQDGSKPSSDSVKAVVGFSKLRTVV